MFDKFEVPLRNSNDIPNLLRDFICYHQSELFQYLFLANEKHKKLKNLLLSYSNQTDDSSKIDDLIQTLDDLENHLNMYYKKVSYESFNYLLVYFAGRSSYQPRICVKVLKNNSISPLFRSNYKTYPEDDETQSLSDNTATEEFKEVYFNRKFYLCNDIPKAVKKGKYKNPRLNIDLAKQYKNPSIFDKLRLNSRLKNDRDYKWIEVWKKTNVEFDSDYDRYYKSTLVLPMSFSTKNLVTEVRQHLKIEQNLERILWGWLCFDHVDTYFFDARFDVPVCNIFADILSLYAVNKLSYTQYSNIFYKSKEIITEFIKKNIK